MSWKILREFTYEDNFNNTFLLKKVPFLADCSTVLRKGKAKVIKGIQKVKLVKEKLTFHVKRHEKGHLEGTTPP